MSTNKTSDQTAAEKAWGFLLLVVGFLAAVAFSALVFKVLVWNIGVVGLAAACGWVVLHISFHTAIGAVFLVRLISSIVAGASTTIVAASKS